MDYIQTESFVKEILRSGLSPQLYYHSFEHTVDVLQASIEIATEEGVAHDDLILLKTAALFHDSGFLNVYQNHEEMGASIARETLPGFGYSQLQIDIICTMILKTKYKAVPETHLEKILCDADLDYLGRDDYSIISSKLFLEWKVLGKMQGDDEWHHAQIRFLEEHTYYTATARKKREPQKMLLLSKLKEMAL